MIWIANDMASKIAIGPRAIALMADLLRHIQHDRRRQDHHVRAPVLPSDRRSRSGWNIGRVNHGEQPA